MPPLIALEEHYIAESDALPKDLFDLYHEQFKHIPGLLPKLKSLDTLRIDGMKTAGITLQIVSHAPGISSIKAEDCAQINDYLASKISPRKDVLRGFASLPMGDPEAAASELRRTVTKHGFVGALVDNHITTPLKDLSGNASDQSSGLGATYYDSPFFHPVWKAAEELDVPIYIHPTFPTDPMLSHYQELPFSVGASLATSGWGWHSDCATHILRLFATGVFDTFPKLKIIVGHFGEMLPFMLGRVNQLSNRWGKPKRSFQTVYDENLVITTSGVWGTAPLATIKHTTKRENVLFSLDWPFAQAEWGKSFWKDVEKSGIYSEDETMRIGWRNAAKLFKLDEGQLVRDAEKFLS